MGEEKEPVGGNVLRGRYPDQKKGFKKGGGGQKNSGVRGANWGFR